ncbi:MAG: hypothetical protein K2Q01_11215, partial [Rickettsiales bacterium]|nr:hypothetical protein [Rickettsiales bacterium]
LDASEMLAVHPAGVRKDKVMTYYAKDATTTGAAGDPSGASAAHGKAVLDMKISEGVAEIRRLAPAR